MTDPAIAGLIGAILGAVVGAIAAHFLAGANPKIGILDIYFDPMQSDDDKAVAKEIFRGQAKSFFLTPKPVLEGMRRNDYVKQPQDFYQHPLQYTFYLFQTNRDNEQARLLQSEIPQVVKDLRRLFNTNLMEEFYSTWAIYNQILWGRMAGEHSRSNFDIPMTTAPQQGGDPKYSIFQDNDGDFIIAIGRYRINI